MKAPLLGIFRLPKGKGPKRPMQDMNPLGSCDAAYFTCEEAAYNFSTKPLKMLQQRGKVVSVAMDVSIFIEVYVPYSARSRVSLNLGSECGSRGAAKVTKVVPQTPGQRITIKADFSILRPDYTVHEIIHSIAGHQTKITKIMRSSTGLLLAAAGLAGRALAHGDHSGAGGSMAHSQKPMVGENASWMEKHMAEEHHADNFDAASFFALHDFDADGSWEPQEILRTYGLMDDSNNHVTSERREEIAREIMGLLDYDKDGAVTKEEFVRFIDEEKKTLPDVGTGPGHHGDYEYEYEIHHWEKYHDENTKLEDLTHPEDIEHFKKHEEMEDEQDRLDLLNKQMIVEENIPAKFRRD
ncbi:hypothetical protein B0H66DRAFT_627390 [Apodospora peruviana]|uniref:EF-hand domain-containing protein n=1 Tax=Apodospora peruviana TaxID=516989 RepID=A0AAE0HZB4_9PEZI|nr:hypothetical protein B0H66DRAFT_627390 [Apodospora peruviana]